MRGLKTVPAITSPTFVRFRINAAPSLQRTGFHYVAPFQGSFLCSLTKMRPLCPWHASFVREYAKQACQHASAYHPVSHHLPLVGVCEPGRSIQSLPGDEHFMICYRWIIQGADSQLDFFFLKRDSLAVKLIFHNSQSTFAINL